MPSIEVTSNAFAVSVPLHITGNIGVGTNAPAYALDIVAPLSFGVNENPVSIVSSGTADARSLSVSSDGNVVVVGRANYQSDGIIYVHEFDGSTWNTSNLTIQDVPPNTYTGYISAWREGARGSISSDGTRIVAVRGFNSASYNANSAEIYHKINGTWVSKAFIHHANSFGFGWAISGDGNTVAFTAPTDQNANYTGYVYVYKYNAGTDTWDQALARSYDYWPDSITLNNDGTILAFSRTNFPVVQTLEDPAVAYVNILKYTNGAWNNANDDIIITPPNGYLYWHYYGKSIRISADGKTLVVGAPSFSNGWGSPVLNAVHVYKTSDGSWVNPTSTILQPPSYTSPSPNDYDNHFGNVVTVNSNGTVIVVGAHGTNVNGITRAGRAWVFQLVNNVWTVVGTLDGTLQNMWFASAVDVTADGHYAFIAARYYDYTGNATLRGVKKYRFMNTGTAIHTSGNMLLSGNTDITGVLDVTGVMNLDGDMNVSGDMNFQGKLQLLDTGANGIPNQLLEVIPPYSITNISPYSTITYEDYTLWEAYTNRTNITPVITYGPYGTSSNYPIPDFGFDFFIKSPQVNSRNSTSVSGGNIVFDDTAYPVLYIGQTVNTYFAVSSEVSYYSGNYNGNPAMYIFCENVPTIAQVNYQTKWCVIMQTNSITLYLKQIQSPDISVLIRLVTYGYENSVFPGDGNVANITDKAYSISFQPARGVGVNVDGAFVAKNVGIGTTNPSTSVGLQIDSGENETSIRLNNVFSNKKISLYELPFLYEPHLEPNPHKFYGFGVNDGALRYQVPEQTASHVFYSGLNMLTSSELMRISGTGDVSIAGTLSSKSVYVQANSDTIPSAYYTATIDEITSLQNNATIQQWGGFTPLVQGPVYKESGGYKDVGSYVTFNRSLNNALNLPDFSLTLPNGFTAYMFCKFTGSPSSTETLFDIGNQNRSELTMYRDSTTSYFNLLYRGEYSSTTFTNVFNIPQNEWVQITLRGTYGYANDSSNITIESFYNGEFISNSTQNISAKFITCQASTFGGARGEGTSLGGKTQFNGDIAAFLFYDYPLTNGELSLLHSYYNIGSKVITATTRVENKSKKVGIQVGAFDANERMLQFDSMYTPDYAYTNFSCNVGLTFGVNNINALNVGLSGNVGIGTTTPATALVVNGTIRNVNGPSPTSGTSLVITGSGDIAPQSSDARYKTNVEDIPSALDAIMNMRAVSYQWKDEPQKWYGLLAQQVAEVFPDAAWHDVEKDTYGVHYTPSIVTLLLKAIQEMKQTYDARFENLEK